MRLGAVQRYPISSYPASFLEFASHQSSWRLAVLATGLLRAPLSLRSHEYMGLNPPYPWRKCRGDEPAAVYRHLWCPLLPCFPSTFHAAPPGPSVRDAGTAATPFKGQAQACFAPLDGRGASGAGRIPEGPDGRGYMIGGEIAVYASAGSVRVFRDGSRGFLGKRP